MLLGQIKPKDLLYYDVNIQISYRYAAQMHNQVKLYYKDLIKNNTSIIALLKSKQTCVDCFTDIRQLKRIEEQKDFPPKLTE